jgi:hypothetical protein
MSNQINGLEMPTGFNTEIYRLIQEMIQPLFESNQQVRIEFVGAWNAIQYRFLSCYESSTIFTESMKLYGDAPVQQQRYIQEKELFNFFANGLSVLESFYYASFAVGNLIDPKTFPMESEGDLKNINPNNSANKFIEVFSTSKLAIYSKQVIDSEEFKHWRNVRNSLMHRVAPPRLIYAGTSNRTYPPAKWVQLEVELDESTTKDRIIWLVNTINSLMSELYSFLSIKMEN